MPQPGSPAEIRFHFALRQPPLGEGSMGIVPRACDRTLREWVLKSVHHASRMAIRYLKKQLLALADLSHPNLEEPYDLFADHGQCFSSWSGLRACVLAASFALGFNSIY